MESRVRDTGGRVVDPHVAVINSDYRVLRLCISCCRGQHSHERLRGIAYSFCNPYSALDTPILPSFCRESLHLCPFSLLREVFLDFSLIRTAYTRKSLSTLSHGYFHDCYVCEYYIRGYTLLSSLLQPIVRRPKDARYTLSPAHHWFLPSP